MQKYSTSACGWSNDPLVQPITIHYLHIYYSERIFTDDGSPARINKCIKKAQLL